jgi:hypothetical protein
MKQWRLFVSVCGLMAAMAGCGTGEFNAESLPEAVGSPGELIVVCDDEVWAGASGLEIRKTYGSEQVGLPQAEPWFRIIRFNESKFNAITRKYRTILLVTTLENDSKTSRYIRDLLGERGQADQLNDSSFVFVESANRWARGQQVLYLIGKDDASLARAVVRKRAEMLAYLRQKELNRVMAAIKAKPRHTALEALIADSLGLQLTLPKSYKLRVAESNFVWVSREDADKTLSLLLSTRPYVQQSDFSAAAVLAYKDSLTRAQVPGPLAGSWYTTEYLAPPDTFASSFAGEYALLQRGLWKVENDFMGGPFVHLTGYDAKRGMLIELEGFVYYPKEKKRELLRELEAIIGSVALVN